MNDIRPIWHAGATLEGMRAFCRNTMQEHLGIELVELGPDFLRGTMPVDHRTCQPMRLLHGGASVVLAETLASVAANMIVNPETSAAVGQEINANHLRGVPEGGTVTGIARSYHLGATSQVWGVEIANARGQLVCVSRVTMAIIRRPPGTATPAPQPALPRAP